MPWRFGARARSGRQRTRLEWRAGRGGTSLSSAASTEPRAPTPTLFNLSPTNLVLWTIVLGTAMRIVLGLVLGYGNGEGYYLASARHFALSYFDHPPLFLWVAGLAIDCFGTSSTLLPRLPFILMFIGTTWLMYRLGAKLFGEWAGAWTAVLLNLSQVFTVSVAGWVQPDAPLFLFLAASGWVAAELCFGAPQQPLRMWVLAGLVFGLAMLSKYHAALILVGLVIFIATTPRHRAWFFKPGLLLAGLIAALIFTPVLWWNLENNWVSFGFQGGRIAGRNGLRLDWLIRSILGQATFISVVIWPPLLWQFYKGLRAGSAEAKSWFLCCLAIVPIILFTAAAIWAPLGWHFHWQAPGYMFLFPLLGKAVAEGMIARPVATRWFIGAAAAAVVLFVTVMGSQAVLGWVYHVLPASAQARPYQDTNPTRELMGWTGLRDALAEEGVLHEQRLFVVTNKWFLAGKADVEIGDALPVTCLSAAPCNIAFGWGDRAFTHWDALIVITGDQDPRKEYGPYFRSITPLRDVEVKHGGKTALTLRVYRATDYHALYPLPYRRTAAQETTPKS